MTRNEIYGIWNYFLALENDLAKTSQYIEPAGQENVFSFEFAKILILACTEVESVFKAICYEIEGEPVQGTIGAYKQTILGKYPGIVTTKVKIQRLGREIEPFAGWNTGPLKWWDAYQVVKHSRGGHFSDASYINAATALSALYILILYLAKIANVSFNDCDTKYLDSEYVNGYLVVGPSEPLPGFEHQHVPLNGNIINAFD